MGLVSQGSYNGNGTGHCKSPIMEMGQGSGQGSFYGSETGHFQGPIEEIGLVVDHLLALPFGFLGLQCETLQILKHVYALVSKKGLKCEDGVDYLYV